MVKLHLKHADLRAVFVQDNKSTLEYPDSCAALICFRAYEFPYETRPFRQLRSQAMYVRPVDSEQARVLAVYNQALRNAARIRRLHKKGLQNGRSHYEVATKLNPVYIPALERAAAFEREFLTSISSWMVPDPAMVIAFYSKPAPKPVWPPNTLWPLRPGVEPTYGKADEFALQTVPSTVNQGTVFEDRSYFLYRHHVWSAALGDAQTSWANMVDLVLRIKDQPPNKGRQIIPEAVRIFVWRRDEGKCTRCASRNRLEYDHIIALANGGSNTARNIELLCETCNRRKGARVC